MLPPAQANHPPPHPSSPLTKHILELKHTIESSNKAILVQRHQTSSGQPAGKPLYVRVCVSACTVYRNDQERLKLFAVAFKEQAGEATLLHTLSFALALFPLPCVLSPSLWRHVALGHLHLTYAQTH